MILRALGSLALSTLLFLSAFAQASIVPERREELSKTDKGFLAFPIYTHIPGIGSTVGFGLLGTNLFNSKTQAVATVLTGDSNADVVGIREIHLIKDTLILNFFAYTTRIPSQIFDRGTDSSPDNNFYLVNKEYGGSTEVDLQFWERRIQFNGILGASRIRTTGVNNSDGLGYNNSDGRESDSMGLTLNFQLDLTDDNVDPRKGFNLQVVRDSTDIFDGLRSRFYTVTYDATGYIPLPHHSTWVFNAYRSGAVVTNHNTSTASDLHSGLNLACSGIADATARATCQATEDLRVQERFNENQYGTSTPLGGTGQMRGFPSGRFRGSQSIFYATEIRWNLSTDDKKFDMGFIKGTRSLIQIAPFYELGASADPPNAVENAKLHASYGVGFRFGFSGTLLRADIAMSDEGPQFTVYLGYPFAFPSF